jgi:hypothetical protein
LRNFFRRSDIICKYQDIGVPDMDACFSIVGQSRRKKKSVTVEHYYQVDIFITIIDQQLQELNNRFNEQAIEFNFSSREAL